MVVGIYQILNSITGDKYIGSTANMHERWLSHRSMLRNEKHHCTHLQSAWNKYGEDAFEFSVLEECASSDLMEREQSYLPTEKTMKALKLNGFYNQSPIAGRPVFVGWDPSDEVREKLSEENRKRWRNMEYRERMTEKARRQWKENGSKMRLGVLRSVQKRIQDSGQLLLFLPGATEEE